MTFNASMHAAVICSLLASSLPVASRAAPRCDIQTATSSYTTITAGRYKLLFNNDADMDVTPEIQHARHGSVFLTNTDSFRIAGPGASCWASPDVGIVTMPVFVGNGRYLYINTYSGSDGYLFVVDAQTCKTLWQSPNTTGDLFRKPYGFFLEGVGRITIGPDCLPRRQE